MKLRKALYLRQGRRCFYCDRVMLLDRPRLGRSPHPDICTVDHINRAVSTNLVVAACYQCNTERGHLPAHEYITVHAERLGLVWGRALP
jgi:hypothetical protein